MTSPIQRKPSPEAPITLVLARSEPGGDHVGGIVLRSLLERLDPSRLVVAVLRPDVERDVDQAGPFPMRFFAAPKEHADAAARGKLGSISAWMRRRLRYGGRVPGLAGRVAEFARQQRVERVWAVLESTIVIDVADRLIDELGVPLLAHVWDDIEYLMAERRLDRLSRRATRARFSRLLRAAEKAAVISERMEQDYASRHQARTVVLRHFEGQTQSAALGQGRGTDDKFRIGFSGSLYAPSALSCLIDALDRLGWKLGGREAVLSIASNSLMLQATRPVRVEYLGRFADAGSATAWLQTCDLLYLPLPFEASRRALAEYSFPTKFVTYTRAGRPVLLHAPTYAGMHDWFRDQGLDALCESLDSARLAAQLDELAASESALADSAERVVQLGLREFSEERYVQQISAFLGESALA